MQYNWNNLRVVQSQICSSHPSLLQEEYLILSFTLVSEELRDSIWFLGYKCCNNHWLGKRHPLLFLGGCFIETSSGCNRFRFSICFVAVRILVIMCSYIMKLDFLRTFWDNIATSLCRLIHSIGNQGQHSFYPAFCVCSSPGLF
jgi:hypothetical protein